MTIKEMHEKEKEFSTMTIDEDVMYGTCDLHSAEVKKIIVVYINVLEKVPTVTKHYDCNHDCDALYEAYDRGFSKGYLEGGADAYCKSDSNALCAAYNNGYSKGFSEGREEEKKRREEEKKEVMLLTDHCIGKCDILESVLHMEGDKND